MSQGTSGNSVLLEQLCLTANDLSLAVSGTCCCVEASIGSSCLQILPVASLVLDCGCYRGCCACFCIEHLRANGSAMLLVGCECGAILCYRFSHRQWLFFSRLAPHSGVVSCIVVVGDAVISGSADCNISVMDFKIKSISVRKVLFGHTQPVAALAVCSRSRALFSASLDGSVRGWSWPNFELVKLMITLPGQALGVSLSSSRGLPVLAVLSDSSLCCAVVRLACKTCGRIGCFSDCCIQERVLRITDPVLASLCCCIRCSHEMSPGHFCVAAGTSDGRVLIFEAQEEKATVSLQRAADFKVGDDAVLSLFWRAGPMPASSISSDTQCFGVTQSGLLFVIRPPNAPGAQWTHRSMQALPKATMSASCFVLGGCMQLAVCTQDGGLHVFKFK